MFWPVLCKCKYYTRPEFQNSNGVDTKGTEGFRYWNPFHGDGQSVNGRINNNFTNLTRWNWQNVLTYTKQFADVHNVNVNLVNEFQQQTVNSFYGAGTNMSSDFSVTTLSMVLTEHKCQEVQ